MNDGVNQISHRIELCIGRSRIDLVESQPLAHKIVDEALRPRVLQHAVGLSSQFHVSIQRSDVSRVKQLRIRQTFP